MKFLTKQGLQRFLDRLKAIIPTKTSDIQNDSGFLTQHNPVDSALSTTSENAVQNKVVKDALDGKSDTGHTHLASEVSGLSTVASSGSYNDLSNTPTIPVVNNKTLTIQKNGTTVNTFTANSASDVTANITVPTAVSELTNDSGYLTSASSLDSSKLTGTIDIARLPKGALERLVTVANQTARFTLTVNDVQLGDTVKQLDTGVMYIVTDESKLSSADGYTEYTAGSATSVPWSGVTGKPSSYTPSSHTHGNVTNDGKLGTASRALITDSNKKITTSSVTSTELEYLSGVTSSVQTQLNGKAASTHVHGSITNDGKVGTTANVPLITGTDGVVQAGSFGNTANTFCEGNDSRLSDARTPVAHTHTKSDVTDLFNSANTWTGDNTYSKPVVIERNTDTGNFLALRNSVSELGSTPASATPVTIAYRDKNDENLGYMGVFYDTDGSNIFRLFVRNKFTSGDPSTSGNVDYTTFQLRLNSDRSKEGILKASFRPYDNNTYNLGSLTYRWNAVYSCGSNVRSGNIDFTDTTTTGMKEHWHFSNAENSGAAFFHIGSQRNHSLGLNEEHFRIKNVNGLWADLYIQLDDNNQFTIGTKTHSDVTNNGFRGKFTPLGSFIPYVNNSYDLGSSTYQWNNTYTKKLYLNGTEFGLDTANTWTAQNSFNSDLNLNYASTDVDDFVNSVAGSSVLDNFVHMTGNETVNGIKSFPDGIVANVTGSATSATNDGSGNVISSTYGKLGANNTWSGDNTYSTSIIYQSNHSLGNLPQDVDSQAALKINDSAGTNYLAQITAYQTTDSTGLRIVIRDKFDSNGFSPSGSNRNKYFNFLQNAANQSYIRWDGYVNNSIIPLADNTYNLGTSTNMWNDIWTGNTDTKYLGLHTTLKTKGVAPSGSGRNNTSIAFRDTNYNLLGKIEHNCYSSGESFLEFSVENNYTNGALDPNGSNVANSLQLYLDRTGDRSFFPSYNNEVYLGASNRQWKSVFAQTYYYNGTQWGLDQANVWSGSNTYSGTVNIYNSDNTQTTPELSLRNSKTEILSTGNTAGSQGIYFADKNGRTITYVGGMVQSNGCSLRFRTFTKDESNNTIESAVQIASFVNGSKWLAPSEDNAIDLGGSVYRWKSFNGLNPGSLSLPDTDSSDVDLIDTGAGSGWNLTGTSTNTYTPDTDGWLCLACADVAGDFLFASYGNPAVRTSISGTGQITNANVGRGLCLYLPVTSGKTVSCLTKASSNFTATFIPCKGNV